MKESLPETRRAYALRILEDVTWSRCECGSVAQADGTGGFMCEVCGTPFYIEPADAPSVPHQDGKTAPGPPAASPV